MTLQSSLPSAEPAAPVKKPSRLLKPLRWLLLAIWVLLALVGIGSLAVNHSRALPGPETAVGTRLLGLRPRDAASRPFRIHVIPDGCSCTRRLLEHLLAQGPFSGNRELILFAGEQPAWARAAAARGFAWHAIGPEALARDYGIEAGPVLLAYDASGRLDYLGGYFDHPAAREPRDQALQARLLRGERPEPLPIFGCAVSPRLRRSLDPLGLVY